MNIPYDIQKGKGSLKYYKYWTGGIRLIRKKDIQEAIELKLRVLRKDRVTDKVELFDYNTYRFGTILKDKV